jgi:hypothetical protein
MLPVPPLPCPQWQVVPLQVLPVLQMPPVQHGSPRLPQSVHVEEVPSVWHTVPLPVQVLFGQQGSVSRPQIEQNPLDAQTSLVPLMQDCPVPTHVPVRPFVSQHPPVHWSPGQQGSEMPPHDWHVVPVHTAPLPLHCSPS